MNQTKSGKRQQNRIARKRLSGMQIAVLALGIIVFLCAAGFGGYLWYEEAQYQKALRTYPVAYTDLIAAAAEKSMRSTRISCSPSCAARAATTPMRSVPSAR